MFASADRAGTHARYSGIQVQGRCHVFFQEDSCSTYALPPAAGETLRT
jgi:hypothetical protein